MSSIIFPWFPGEQVLICDLSHLAPSLVWHDVIGVHDQLRLLPLPGIGLLLSGLQGLLRSLLSV